MIETAIAALVPAAVLLLVTRGELRRASLRWFVPVTLLIFAPYWLTGRIPAPLDFLAAHVVPWMKPGVVVSNALQSDVVMQILPWRDVVTRFWRHGQWPIENPFSGAGAPLWVNPQAAVLHPITLLGLPFSTFGWTIFAAVSRMLIALSGMFLFLREEGRSERAAVFGAIAFAFCGLHIAYFLYPLVNVTMMLPWLLVAIRRQSAIGCAIATMLLLLGGHPQSVLHVAVLAIPYALFVVRGNVVRYGLAAVVGGLLAAPVVVPFLFAAPGFDRAAHTIGVTPFEPAQLLPFVFPARFAFGPFAVPGANFAEVATQYAGFATFALAVWAIVRKAKDLRFWIAMLAIVSIAAFLPGGPVQMGRLRFVVAFILAFLSAYGFDLERNHQFKPIVLTVLGVVIVSAFVFWPQAVELQIAPVVAATVATALISAAALAWAPRAIPVALAVDLGVLLLLSIPGHGRSEFYPETGAIRFLEQHAEGYRIAGVGGSLFPNTSSMFGIADIRVHDPSAPEAYLGRLERGGLVRRLYFHVFPGFPSPQLARELAVRYLIAPPGVRSPLPAVYRGPDAVIFMNPAAQMLPPAPVPKPRGWWIGWLLGLLGVAALPLLKLRNNAALASR